MTNTNANEQQALISEAFGHAQVTCDMTRRAFAIGFPIKLLWSMAGAGLANLHREFGIAVSDIREALKHERKGNPYIDNYIDGYNSAMLQAKIATTGGNMK